MNSQEKRIAIQKGEPSQAEKCRVIAECLLGWHRRTGDGPDDWLDAAGEMVWAEAETFNPWKSEDASALILEKLIQANCRILIDRGGMTIYGPPTKKLIDTEILYDARGRRFDNALKRTAIAEAGYAVAMAERAAKEKNG